MPPGGGALRTWLRTAFALDSTLDQAGGIRPRVPPAFPCLTPRGAGHCLPAAPVLCHGQRPPCLHRTPQRRLFSGASATPREDTTAALPNPDAEVADESHSAPPRHASRRLPLQCPGCGAFSQTEHSDQPGFFDLSRQSTMQYLGLVERKQRVRTEDRVVREALQRLELEASSEVANLAGLVREREGQDKRDEGDGASPPNPDAVPTILCARCHDLVHHHAGHPIHHPDLDAIRETIAESPYKYNHVYHILDAADFPMSLLPRIHDLLRTMPLRSRNRRSRPGKFYGSRFTDMSFVVTRSDLFAPRKDQVDRLMPWIRETLRDALGRRGRHVRLGAVHCVSARRNWWTSELKEEIWKRGGANWLVGKANVGKSYLVHHIFPKGRMAATAKRGQQFNTSSLNPDPVPESDSIGDSYDARADAELESGLDNDALLPPRPRETNYPQMPVVSALPGTTASPIRIPFGGGKGELIDLPGLARTSLADYVQDFHRDSLVMKTRIQPEQVVLKDPSQSLLLGGLVRITPRTPDLVFLAYNFSPLRGHKTSTEKAAAIQAQSSELNVESIAAPGTGDTMRLAGSFPVKYDVTKLRAGPITRRDAVNISVERLPYRVMALDLLIEGCGWVEIVAQVSTRKLYYEPSLSMVEQNGEAADALSMTDSLLTPQKSGGGTPKDQEGDLGWPVVDVYSPDGRFVGARRPLNAQVLGQQRASKVKKSRRTRPKKSMRSSKERGG